MKIKVEYSKKIQPKTIKQHFFTGMNLNCNVHCGRLHSTEVAFALLTRQSQVQFWHLTDVFRTQKIMKSYLFWSN